MRYAKGISTDGTSRFESMTRFETLRLFLIVLCSALVALAGKAAQSSVENGPVVEVESEDALSDFAQEQIDWHERLLHRIETSKETEADLRRQIDSVKSSLLDYRHASSSDREFSKEHLRGEIFAMQELGGVAQHTLLNSFDLQARNVKRTGQ